MKSTEISAALLLTNMLKEVFATCSLNLLLSDSVLLFCRSAVRLFVAAAFPRQQDLRVHAILVNDVAISPSEEIKFLGIIVDDKLSVISGFY